MRSEIGWRRSAVPCLFAAALLLPSSALAASPEAERVKPQQLEEKQKQLADLRTRIEHIRDAVRSDHGTRDALTGELREVELRIGQAGMELRQSEQALEALQRRLGAAIVERDLAESSLSEERGAMRAQIRSAYALGRQQRLKLLLRQGEPESIGRALVYYDYLHAARSRRIAGYSARLDELRSLESEIEYHRGEIDGLRKNQAMELEAQQVAFAERRKVLAILEARLQTNEDTLRALEDDEAALQKLVKELQKALRELARSKRREPFASRRGKLQLPVEGALTVGGVEARARQVAGAHGITLAASAGTAVRAVHGGQVVFADWLNRFGLLLIVDHGAEFLTIYAHNESFYRRVGDWVAAGEVIATVGNSGGQARNALYFEIRHRGAPVDPLPWFTEKPLRAASPGS